MSMIKYGLTQEDEDEAVKTAQLDSVFAEVARMTPQQVREWLKKQRKGATSEASCPDPTSTSK